MSLKEPTINILTRYGLEEKAIAIYLRYLSYSQATISQVFVSFEEEEELGITHDEVVNITNDLVQKGFLKKIEGIVDRYIPLEPYFELFTNESEIFRNEIGKIKDNVLADQSNRFDKLEEIQSKSIQEVDTAVDAQISAFNDDSDAKSAAKQERITKATTRFNETSKALEKELHGIVEQDYSRLTDDINKVDKDSDAVWDNNSQKFTTDNQNLNTELTNMVKSENEKLDQLSETQINASKEQESKIHQIMDALNAELQKISSSFVSQNETGVNTAKENLNKLISDLQADFQGKIEALEREMKQALDGHVDRHKNIANELKPKMEQILEKYLERMNKVITDLKGRITNLLKEHVGHVTNTTGTIESQIHSTVETRHSKLQEQVNQYKNKAVALLKELLEEANRFSDFSEDITNVGFFFGKKKKSKFVGRWTRIEESIASISRTYENDFLHDWEVFVDETRSTTNDLKTEVTGVLDKEKNILSNETDELDTKAQETISAELETLATDMASEIDTTLQSGIKDCSDTTIKLKDSVEKNFSQHHKTYQADIDRHNQDTLKHYDDFDREVKRNNETWVKEVDSKVSGGKRDITTEIDNQNSNITKYKDDQKANIDELLKKMTQKNVEHSKTFGNDVNEVKTKQRQLYDELLAKVRADFDKSKATTTEKIDAEIQLWSTEGKEMDGNLSQMLEDHKAKYKDNATTLQASLTQTTKDTIQNTKDAIADFTLEFMNSIDDSTELAETNEDKLNDIHNSSKVITEVGKSKSWHTVGRDALITAMKDTILRTKSSIIIVTPIVIPEILQLISEFAYKRKAARFMLTSKWDMQAYGGIIKKMLQLGNIQFRNLTSEGEYYAVTRDAEEVIICPAASDEADMISLVSTQEGYAKLYSQVIGPMFLSNSRPIK